MKGIDWLKEYNAIKGDSIVSFEFSMRSYVQKKVRDLRQITAKIQEEEGVIDSKDREEGRGIDNGNQRHIEKFLHPVEFKTKNRVRREETRIVQ